MPNILNQLHLLPSISCHASSSSSSPVPHKISSIQRDVENKYDNHMLTTTTTDTLDLSKISRITKGFIYTAVLQHFNNTHGIAYLGSLKCWCRTAKDYSKRIWLEFHKKIHYSFDQHRQTFDYYKLYNTLHRCAKDLSVASENPTVISSLKRIQYYLEEYSAVNAEEGLTSKPTSYQLMEERLELFYHIATLPQSNLYLQHYQLTCPYGKKNNGKAYQSCAKFTEIGLRMLTTIGQDISRLRMLNPMYTLPSLWQLLSPIYEKAIHRLSQSEKLGYALNSALIHYIDDESADMITILRKPYLFTTDKLLSFHIEPHFQNIYLNMLGDDEVTRHARDM